MSIDTGKTSSAVLIWFRPALLRESDKKTGPALSVMATQ